MAKHVVFDVVGTCVSFDAYYEKIEQVLGAKLRQQGLGARHFGYTWQTAAELEFTFLSVAGSYQPYRDVMRGLFYRTLGLAGVADPHALATDAERDACIDEGYARLALRPDATACFARLRAAGFTVSCFTAGDVARVQGYFERAAVAPLPPVISCDDLGVAKPAPAAYEAVWQRLGPDGDGLRWFAAAHMWDVAAATKVGFRGAWCAALEKEPCPDVFRDTKMEVMADNLLELAEAIISKSSG